MAALSGDRWRAASPYLDRAMELGEDDRHALLAQLRAADPVLAGDVEELLAESRAVQREGFLERGPALPPMAGSLSGRAIGPYVLVSQIGQGGMGGVWLARRADGRFEGLVAVKLLNPGLVGRVGEERFRREGTFLARLAHPHIARLHDAGVSPTGQPYLVLEYVDGEPIDRYCDGRSLDVAARLHLFLEVLAAVAHAHANLIVHRDIKPSNVLVGRDGHVRLLDFGIAKLVEPEAGGSEATELTREGGRALTPEYAAPEQLTGDAITTATDVYALGALLYLLLGGCHPTPAATRSTAGIVQAIVETEPRRLSEAASDARTRGSEATAQGAARRATTPEGLRRLLRGDLDTIVAKALKKDPEARYGSVAEFADDVRRYLRREPVSARPDTLAYRGAKFVRRHAGAVTAAAGVLALVAGLTAFYTARLAQERNVARLQAGKATQVAKLLTELLTGADPYSNRRGGEVSVRALLDAGAGRIDKELAGQPELQAEMLTVMGRVYQRLGVLDTARALLERGLAVARRAFGPQDDHVAQALNDLGVVLREEGDNAAAAGTLEETLAMRRKLLGPDHPDVAVTLVELGRAYADEGLDVRAEPLFREALAMRRRTLGEDDHDTATSESDLGLLLWRKGDLEGAESLFRRCLATDRRTSGGDGPDVASALNNLALVLMARSRFRDAEPLLREAVAITRSAFGETHPSLAPKLNNLANVLCKEGKYGEAERVAAQGLEVAAHALGERHPLVATCAVTLARIDLTRGEAKAAEALLRQALAVEQGSLTSGDWRVADVQSLLGEDLTRLGRFDEAGRLLTAAGACLRDVPGREGQVAEENRARLAALARARSAAHR